MSRNTKAKYLLEPPDNSTGLIVLSVQLAGLLFGDDEQLAQETFSMMRQIHKQQPLDQFCDEDAGYGNFSHRQQ